MANGSYTEIKSLTWKEAKINIKSAYFNSFVGDDYALLVTPLSKMLGKEYMLTVTPKFFYSSSGTISILQDGVILAQVFGFEASPIAIHPTSSPAFSKNGTLYFDLGSGPLGLSTKPATAAGSINSLSSFCFHFLLSHSFFFHLRQMLQK